MTKLTFSEYQQVDAINWSTLREMRKSPAHYIYRLKNPRKDSTRLAIGRASHTAILEVKRFLKEYVMWPRENGDRRGKKWDAFKEQHAARTILKEDEYDLCIAISEAVEACPAAAAYLDSGQSEHSVLWTDATTGQACKGRIDWVSSSKSALVDIKTTNDVSPNRFGTTAARMGYHIQGAWYQAGYLAATGRRLPVVTIAVEVEPPHDVAVYVLDEDALYAGEQEWMRLISDVASCKKSGKWPGRFTEEQVLRLPSWAVADDEEDVGGFDLLVNSQSTSTGG